MTNNRGRRGRLSVPINPDHARRTAFWFGWAFGRIAQLLEERGTQNDNGEWRVVHFSDPLGPAIILNRPRIKW